MKINVYHVKYAYDVVIDGEFAESEEGCMKVGAIDLDGAIAIAREHTDVDLELNTLPDPDDDTKTFTIQNKNLRITSCELIEETDA